MSKLMVRISGGDTHAHFSVHDIKHLIENEGWVSMSQKNTGGWPTKEESVSYITLQKKID